jgi:transposase InsO family protein
VRGRTIKILSVVDEYTRECLALEVRRTLKAADVIDVLADLFVIRGAPKCIRSDNGPEFAAAAIRQWLAKAGVDGVVHHAWLTVGEWLRREFSQPLSR